MSAASVNAVPIVAVDQIVDISDHGIRTMKAISGSETFFLGHYPDFPIFPGVFVLEAVHQSLRLFVSVGLRLPLHAKLAEIRSVRFLSPLRPGDVLLVDAKCERPSEDTVAVDAHCWRREATLVAVARIKLRYALER